MDTAEKPSAASLRAGTLPDPRRIHVRYTRAGLLTAASPLFLTFSGFPNGIREKLSQHSNGIVQDSHLLPFSPATIYRHLCTIKFMLSVYNIDNLLSSVMFCIIFSHVLYNFIS